MSEATRRAELALFSGANAETVRTKAAAGEPAGRILPSLIEPPAPPEAEPEDVLPKRRGRKPGSKNKPKVPLQDASEVPVAMPAAHALPEMRSGGDRSASATAHGAGETPADDLRHDPSAREPRRPRLRDRSRILARYVHGTAPAPGDGWMRRGSLNRRAGRKTPRT